MFTVIRTLTGHKSSIRCVDFHPYGDFVASGSLDSDIKVCASLDISDRNGSNIVRATCCLCKAQVLKRCI